MASRQRIEGQVQRSFALAISKRAAPVAPVAPVDGEDQAEQALLAENLVLEFPFSSEEPYLRSSWWDEPWVEVLGHGDGECDLTRLNSGAAVLLNHGCNETEDAPMRSIGTTTRAWLEGGRGYVEIKLSRRDGMEGLVQDILDGIVRNISVGYQILERTLIKQTEGAPDEYRVTKWLPMEVSIVDIPADATVGIGRSIEQPKNAARYTVVDLPDEGLTLKGSEMPDNKTTASGGTQQPDIAAIRAEAIAAERTRAADIRTAVRSAGFEADYAETLVNSEVTVDAARAVVLEKLAARTAATPVSSQGNIRMIGDETETRREFMANAIMHRANPNHKLEEGAREYAGLSMLELARDCLEIRGIKTRGMDKMQLAQRAFEGTSDLPSVLANVANKSLRQAYLSAPRTFTPWARQASAADFKTISRTNLSDAPALEKVNENGEFKRGSVTDGKETYQLATVGKIIGFTRQSIINDDLNALTRVPALFANAAANYESDTVYGIVTANAALADTIALFHASHNNLTGTGTVLSVTSLGVARAVLRKQTTPQGAVMNLQPKFLIVPAALETIANQYVSQAYVAAKSADFNPFAGALSVIAEARLDANSATAWYLAAESSQIDTVEYCYLEGQNGVYIETRQGFEVDGLEIKARLDFAAKAIDYRGLYKNVGA
jgi:hypothetical protein